jgi:hypothetical protein
LQKEEKEHIRKELQRSEEETKYRSNPEENRSSIKCIRKMKRIEKTIFREDDSSTLVNKSEQVKTFFL